MKKINIYQPIICLLLVFAIFGQALHNELLLMDYVINTSEYTAHCVNRQKTEIHCNGKCLLGEKMGDDQDANSHQIIVKIDQTVLFYEFSDKINFVLNFLTEDNKDFPVYTFSNGIKISDSILRPPIV